MLSLMLQQIVTNQTGSLYPASTLVHQTNTKSEQNMLEWERERKVRGERERERERKGEEKGNERQRDTQTCRHTDRQKEKGERQRETQTQTHRQKEKGERQRELGRTGLQQMALFLYQSKKSL